MYNLTLGLTCDLMGGDVSIQHNNYINKIIIIIIIIILSLKLQLKYNYIT